MRILILALLFLARPLAAQDLLLATWNIKDLGGSKTDEEIAVMARLLKDADIVAIQEVVGKDPAGAKAVSRLADALNRTGAKWDNIVSHPTTGSPGQSERYAFLWKTSKATLLAGHGLVSQLADTVIREPFVARFRAGSREMVLVNFHAIPNKEDPAPEIKQVLRLARSFGDLPVVFGVTQSEQPLVESFTLVGLPIELTARPRWVWDFATTSLATTSAGRRWPDATVDHAYRRSGIAQVRVTAVWEATYEVAGVGPLAIDEPVTQRTSLEVPVGQGRAVLVR